MVKYAQRPKNAENMRSSFYGDTAKGVSLGLIAFMMVFSAVPIPVTAASGNGAPYFSMTLIAPTSNPSRRQWAAVIQNSYSSAGIDTNLIYVSFSQLLGYLLGCSNGCPANDFAHGGWDAGFVGNGGGTALPDFGTQNVVFYKNEGPSDIPPLGSNYYFFKNSTYNALSDRYGGDFNATDRLVVAKKMVAIIAQERPGVIIDYPESVYAFQPTFKPWGQTNAVIQTTTGLDWMHWQTGNQSVVNVALTGDLDAVNPFPTPAQNSFYDRYMYGPTLGVAQEADSRGSGVYINSEAKSITSSSDHLTWTVTLKPSTFIDGVSVTADDYLFSQMSSVRSDVGYVGAGTTETLIGFFSQYTYLNGTTDFVNNGTYSRTQPSGWTPTSVWTSINASAFKFTMPTAYIFTNPLVTAISPVAMHIYEQYPASTWSSGPLSGYTGSSGGLSTNRFTVTWNTARYGGNGSYAWAYGPIGDGAYMYRGYDPVAQTATLVAYPGYWNATGLKALNEFTVQTIHVVHIIDKTAAIAAFGNKQINFLDPQYTFNVNDEASLKAAGAGIVLSADPSNGWQEMVLNDNAPVWGTGAGTPLGSSDPSKAAFAAKEVRAALNYLVPRQSIVTNLLQGLALPGITEFFPTAGVIHAGDVYGTIKADPYDVTAALSFLAAAGYNTNVAPPPGSGISLPAPPIIAATCSSTTGGGSTTVTIPPAPSFLLGNTLVLSGTFPVNVAVGTAAGGFGATLQQSTDGGKTWTPIQLTSTTTGGYYTISFTPSSSGQQWYRVFFTGVPWTYLSGLGIAAPQLAEAYEPPGTTTSHLAAANTTDTQYSAVTNLNVGSYGDVLNGIASALNQALTSLSASQAASVNNGLCNLQKALTNSTNAAIAQLSANTNSAIQSLQSTSAKSSDLTSLQNSVNTLSGNVNTLTSQVNTLTDIAYAALAVAVILGLAAIFLSRRKAA